MGRLIAGMASSHAFTFLDPDVWDARRESNRDFYARIYGQKPESVPGIVYESPEECRKRYRRIAGALDQLRRSLAENRPDVLIVVGDDQNEHFKEISPQIAIYVGDSFVTQAKDAEPLRHLSDGVAARAMHEALIERDFDVTGIRSFPEDRLFAHAFTPILETVTRPLDLPVILLFINSIHVPAATPGRCYELGTAVRQIVEASSYTASIYGSGGLSHFTGGYPWPHYTGPHRWGSIVEEFDRRNLATLERGDGASLARLSSRELLDNGEIELRSWIAVAGAMGTRRARILAYEPTFRAIMAMGVAEWPDF